MPVIYCVIRGEMVCKMVRDGNMQTLLLLEARIDIREALELVLVDRGNKFGVSRGQHGLFSSELRVKVGCLALALACRLEWRLHLKVGKLDPVYVAEEGVVLDVSLASWTAAKALLRVARQEL